MHDYVFSSVQSFTELTRFAFTIPGVEVLLSEKLSQDPLEQFFACQQQRGSASENPIVAEFCKNTREAGDTLSRIYRRSIAQERDDYVIVSDVTGL